MTIHRVYSDRTLQLDVNLVTREFPVILADALDRVLGHEIEMLTRPDKRTGRGDGMVAAQAG
jgi:hypothetical protein